MEGKTSIGKIKSTTDQEIFQTQERKNMGGSWGESLGIAETERESIGY
jgi:hypothetical protein